MNVNDAQVLYSKARQCFSHIKLATEEFQCLAEDGEMLAGFTAWKAKTNDAVGVLVNDTGVNIIPGEIDFTRPIMPQRLVEGVLWNLLHDVNSFEIYTVFGGTTKTPQDYVKQVLGTLVDSYNGIVADFKSDFKDYLPHNDSDIDSSEADD